MFLLLVSSLLGRFQSIRQGNYLILLEVHYVFASVGEEKLKTVICTHLVILLMTKNRCLVDIVQNLSISVSDLDEGGPQTYSSSSRRNCMINTYPSIAS